MCVCVCDVCVCACVCVCVCVSKDHIVNAELYNQKISKGLFYIYGDFNMIYSIVLATTSTGAYTSESESKSELHA